MDDALIEQVVSAERDVDPVTGRIVASAAWYDLTAEERAEAFERIWQQRAIEAALHPDGLSQTARAILEQLRSTP